MKFTALFDWFMNLLKVMGPALIIFFTLAIFAGLLKWTNRTKDWIKEVSKNPILLFLWVILTIIAIYLFYRFVMPLLGG